MTIDEAAERLSTDAAGVRKLLAEGRLRSGAGSDEIDPLSVIEVLATRISEATLMATAADRQPFVAALGVPMSLLLWVLFGFVFLFGLADGQPIVHPAAMAAITAAWLGATAALARWGGGLGTMNGLGVAIYGRRDSPAGKVGTAWLVAMFVPLVPLRSYVVLQEVEHERTMHGGGTSYRLADAPLCWPQIVPIFVGVWAAIAAVTAWLAFA